MLVKLYYNIKLPDPELVSSKNNSLHKNGKIYEVTFDNKKICAGSTCEELETWFKWHKSQVYKLKNNNPQIKLIVNCLCKDRNRYMEEYSKKKFGEMLLNKRCNSLYKKETKHFYKIDNEQNLHKRAGLEIKECNNMCIIGTIVKGLRV